MNPSRSVDMETPNGQPLQPIGSKIHKVPPLIRREDRSTGAYDPKVVSFGPYHHGKPELQTCEDVKRLAVQMFVQGSNHDQEFFQAKVLEVISEARNCYIDGSTDQCTDEQFAEMMLLDSCFLISLIYTSTMNLRAPQGYLGYASIFLRLGTTMVYGRDSVSKFLQMAAWNKFDELHEDIKQRLEESSPLHLLEALRMVLVWDKTPASLAQIKQLMQDYRDDKGNVDFLKHEKTFRSAKDLKAKGIFFRPSSSKSFKAINFNSFTFYGKLELPSTYVSSFSRAVFVNLIAYELCPNNLFDMTVISYVNFMKSMIISPADAKELREKRILLTSWTDEDVVRLYKDLDTFEVATFDNYIYVIQKIQEHYDSKAKTWMAQPFHTYFSTPWSVIAWFAAVFVLVLTVLQTYFTINPKSDSGQLSRNVWFNWLQFNIN